MYSKSGSPRAFIIAVALATGATLASMAPVSASTETSTAIVSSLDTATCAFIISAGAADPQALTVAQREVFAKAKSTDCTLRSTTTVTKTSWLQPAVAAAATSCRQSNRQMGMYVGGVETATIHINFYWCSNGTNAWHNKDDYMNCFVTTIPLMFGGSDWCGVINNNQPVAYAHSDFYIAAYLTPWWHRAAWAESRMYYSGGASDLYGAFY